MIQAAVVGYGNVGRCMVEAVTAAPDFELCGVVRRSTHHIAHKALADIPVVDNMINLERKPDVALLCIPTDYIGDVAEKYLGMGISTVDSFDIHAKIPSLRARLDPVARQNSRVAVTAAGWDPGSDSIIRVVMDSCAPKGLTFTNFGPGMSMGHSSILRTIDGVRDGVVVTIPKGAGLHRRMCYVQLEERYDPRMVKRKILEHPNFVNSETHVEFVESVEDVRDKGTSVLIERKGVSGKTHGQHFSFKMEIHNPAVTAQMMVSSARAAMRQSPGCYTLVELPPIDLLPGDREQNMSKYV